MAIFIDTRNKRLIWLKKHSGNKGAHTLKWLKGFIALVVVLVLVLVGSIAFVILGIDPNSYKPELEKLARQNDIELAIEGDLGWSFYPNLAIHAGATSLAGKAAGIPGIHFEQANFTLDWKALLSRSIRLRAITIDGADIRAESAQEAASVAALPGAAASTQKTATTELPFELAIDQLSLTNSRFTLAAPGTPDRVIEQLNFTSSQLNLDGKAFPIDLTFKTTLPEQPTPLSVALDSALTLQLEDQQVALSNATLSLTGYDKLPLTLNFNARYNGQTDALNLDKIEGQLGSAKIKGMVTGQKLTTAPVLAGELSVNNLILKALPFDAPEGFKKAAIQSGFSVSEQAVKLDNLKLSLDDFSLTGGLSLKLDGVRQLDMTLAGNDLTLPASGEGSTNNGNQAALLAPLLAPLALLEGGKGHVELNLKSITSDNIRLGQLHLNLFTNNNILEITDLSGEVFDGEFKATTKVNLQDKTPRITFTKQLVDIDLHQALTTLAEQSDIRGRLTMDFTGASLGDTQEALMANLAGNGKLNVSNLQVENINVERGYCEMAALVEKQPLANQSWSESTKLKDLQGNFQWREQKITLPAFTTGLGNLAVSGNGIVNLDQQTYNMLINANLQGDRTSETGCIVKSKRIRNRDIPLRCTGSFAENGEGNCLPDKQFINQLLQEKIKEKLFDQFLKPKADASQPEATENNQETTPEEPADIKEQVIDTLLKGIFR